ncbi:MAG: hypothetical protein ACI88A_003175 [Paraglaciecola sp.]|jgi:hypothetical protein
MANKLKGFVTSLPGLENITIKDKPNSQDTEWYISMFFCPVNDLLKWPRKPRDQSEAKSRGVIHKLRH